MPLNAPESHCAHSTFSILATTPTLASSRGDDLAALSRVGRRRQRQRHVERRRDAGFLEQRLGLLRVVRIDAGEVDVAGVARHHVAADRRAEAFLRAVDDRLAVDRGGERAAHAHVVEGLLLVVDRHDRLAFGAADDDREARIVLELLQALERAVARHAVDVAGEQRRDLRGRVVDEAEGHLLHLHLGGVAVLVVLHQRDRRALGPGVELERAGADRLRRLRRRALRVEDHGRVLAHAEEEVAVGVGEHARSPSTGRACRCG